MPKIDIDLPGKLREVFLGKALYRGAYGGRGSGKSIGFADMALAHSLGKKKRILCARELQNSVKDSVQQTLIDEVERLGLQKYFTWGESYFRSCTGTEFLFRGLRHNYREIKSLKGITLCLVEEAEAVSESSWKVLIPTVIRNPGSELWLVWNPESVDSATNRRFILNPPANSKIVKLNYQDNPWFTEELEQVRQDDLRRDPDYYAHVWEGECITRTDAQVLAGRWRVEKFERPTDIDGPYYGLDWGFGSDPLAVIICFIKNNVLYIEYETGGTKIEINETIEAIDSMPEIKQHAIRADNARPELISYVRGHGYDIRAAAKWPGSVKDGITHLRGYDAIVIHERCVQTAKEARLWSYKIDRLSGDILPVLVDANNHYWDAVRYAIEPIIRNNARISSDGFSTGEMLSSAREFGVHFNDEDDS